ncbi:hypothetical protein [Hymenobacter sp. PAMC 26628]|uniref:hypothetical protein n=1 Tax=Hymenobacter sp. PAMC 26628 TaxID=1484118 RepID=UPI0012FFB3A8|nr:hypothetical protein [Hymenobacter sp. PAMC 26628]
MEDYIYQYRIVSVGHRRHVEITGFQPADEFELAELLHTLQHKHGWQQGLQVFIGQGRDAVGTPLSTGLANYYHYIDEMRVGSHRSDVTVTPWTKDSLT